MVSFLPFFWISHGQPASPGGVATEAANDDADTMSIVKRMIMALYFTFRILSTL
jgi:hypothetical protein